MESKLVSKLLHHSSEAEEDTAVRLQSTTLLMDLWYEESTVLCNMGPLQDGSEVRDLFYDILKSSLTHLDKVYKLTVFGAAFAILDRLL